MFYALEDRHGARNACLPLNLGKLTVFQKKRKESDSAFSHWGEQCDH